MNTDDHWMNQALGLAERGRGAVEPNPLVGAVVVQNGALAGEGYHHRFGEGHAEVEALSRAGERARGATLYCTLEPCCHFGKTPPCTETILRAGIQRVVAAMADPYPEVAGKGAARLREAGIEVEIGLGGKQARRLNAPYLKLLATGLPYVHAKWAMSLDGKIATRTGQSRWISSEESRFQVHYLRGRMDAIIVGIGTALADDPLLTARPPGPRTPVRIVLDSHGRLPLTSQLVRTAHEAQLLLVTAGELPAERQRSFETHGCRLLALPGENGRPALDELLRHLGEQRMTNILVEGGSAVLGSFLDAGAIDEVHAFVAPILIGGTEAVGPFAGRGFDELSSALRMDELIATTSGADVYLHGRWRLQDVPD